MEILFLKSKLIKHWCYVPSDHDQLVSPRVPLPAL